MFKLQKIQQIYALTQKKKNYNNNSNKNNNLYLIKQISLVGLKAFSLACSLTFLTKQTLKKSQLDLYRILLAWSIVNQTIGVCWLD